MDNAQVLAAVITASVTLTGVLLTLFYSLLRERYENKRHNRQIEIDERRAKFDEAKLAIELYNTRETKIFEARLNSYRDLFSVLMPLEKRAIPNLTSESALEIEKNLKEVFYCKVSHSLSAESIETLTNLRDSLITFSKGSIPAEKIGDVRRELLRSLHRDLGRMGSYLGENDPLTKNDVRVTETILRKDLQEGQSGL